MIDMFQSAMAAKGMSGALTSAAMDRPGSSGATLNDLSQLTREFKTSLDSALSSASAAKSDAIVAVGSALAEYKSTLSVFTSAQAGNDQSAVTAKANTSTASETGSSNQLDDILSFRETPVPESTAQPVADTAAQSAVDTDPAQSTETTLFTDFDSFKTWESNLGGTFAADYETPDYVHMMGLSLGGGEGDAFKRYLFFKNNPQYAADFQAIHQGKLSAFPTDGSTLIRSDMTQMPTDVAEKYRQNPESLRLAEGLNMDPVLYQQRLDGKLDVPSGVNATEWLMQNKWTASGVVANNNRSTFATANYVGLSGSGNGNYRMARYGQETGQIIDFDGAIYDPTTGQKTGQASAAVFAQTYGLARTTA